MGSAMAKQALGVESVNYRRRPDTRSHLLHYPQAPLLRTQTMRYVHFTERPAGQNFVVAVLSFEGYNMQDALVFSKAAIERGLGRSSFFRYLPRGGAQVSRAARRTGSRSRAPTSRARASTPPTGTSARTASSSPSSRSSRATC